MDDTSRFQNQKNAMSAVQYSAGQQQPSMADMAQLGARMQNAIPDGWHVADTSPSGLNRLLPDDCRPISLPHNRTRTQATFSARFWMSVAGLTIVGCVVTLVRLL